MALATVAELETRLGVPVGSLAGEELARAQAALNDASELVLTAGRSSWTDAEGATPAPPVVVVVVLRLAKRIYQNPDEYTWAQMGDFAYTRRDAGGLLTDSELALIRQAAGVADGAYSVATPSAYERTS